MIRPVEGYEKYVGLVGFKDAHIENAEFLLNQVRKKLPDVEIQFFDASLVAGWQHLYFASVNALKSFRNGTNISKSIAVETLLYASAQRQIRAGVDLIGLKKDTSRIVVLGVTHSSEMAAQMILEISRYVPGVRDDSVIDLHDEKIMDIRDLFGITNTELTANSSGSQGKAALVDLVIEHMALLVTRR
jgi:tRNA threonylcarbamoyladenosine modification (KEOPS) complex Cgi121 subunit